MRKGSAKSALAQQAPILHEDIRDKLAKGDHLDLLCHRRGRMVQTVDFHQNVVMEPYNIGRYQMYLSASIPKNVGEVVCLLPNNMKDLDQQVIRSSNYTFLHSFNKDINKSLAASLETSEITGRIKLAICYGSHIFVCNEITGTVYIVWATHVNRINGGNVANTIYNNVPVVINMDGQARLKAIFILKATVEDEADLDRVPITKESPRLLFKASDPIFVCEVLGGDPFMMATMAEVVIKTMSEKDALATVMTTTPNSLSIMKREQNPFAASVDVELDVGVVDGGTPRETLYMEEFVGATNTPPVIQSDGGEKRRDPFEEED